MNLENSVKDCITKELEKGIIEKVISEKLECCIAESIDDMFKWNGVIKKAIEKKLEETMAPFIENYNYSELIPKLDHVLTEVLKTLNMDNKKLLENFQSLMMKEVPVKIKLTEIFSQWKKFVEEKLDRNKIKDFDYEGACIDVNMNAEEVSSDWSSYETKVVTFTCDTDEDMNVEFKLTRWKESNKDTYRIEWKTSQDLSSLRHLNKFDMFMMNLSQAYSNIEIDKEYNCDEIIIEYSE